MVRTYNIGTECYALLISHTDPEFLLPVKIVILEKYTLNSKVKYKVKVKEIFESDLDYLKKHLYGFRVAFSLKNTNQNILIKVDKLETIKSMSDLLTYLNTKPFFVEDNYIILVKNGLKELYHKFLKYMINFHYKKLYDLMSRNFIANTPIFENQKDMFKKRIEKIGFGDMFQKYNLNLKL